MATMNEIERLTKVYSENRDAMALTVSDLEDEIAEAKRKYMTRIKRMVDVVVGSQTRLKAAIEESPELFKKPRTIVFYGIKVGFQKGKGEIKWEDAVQVVKLIHKHFPDQVDMLIKTTELPVKSALAQLPVHELKKLGVTVIETGDQVIIKSTDTEIDKLVSALLKEDEIAEAKEAA